MTKPRLTEKDKQRIENESIVTEQDQRNLRMIKAEVRKQTHPTMERAEKVLDRFEAALPFLERCNKDHNNHTVWLVGLTAAVFLIGVILFFVSKKVEGLI